MRDFLFHIERDRPEGLQSQLRRAIVTAVLNGHLKAGEPMPSSRMLAKRLGIARNTVILAYQRLVEQDYLTSRERSGYFVNDDIAQHADLRDEAVQEPGDLLQLDWSKRLIRHPSRQRNISKPADWRDYPYPFIHGQQDVSLFPLAAWRECSRDALGRLAVEEWMADQFGADDAMLVDQIRTRILPRRGVRARADEILITMGAQNALWTVAALTMTSRTRVGVENPGYVDARNMFKLRTAKVIPLPIDDHGLIVDERLTQLNYVYVTPGHQSPTAVTLPKARRQRLLKLAEDGDFIIIEDDYEGEVGYLDAPTPALKNLDQTGRVIYVGSLSKHLAPGLRLGFLVAPAAVIREARYLRRLILRHPPSNNQRCMALFIAQGHYDSLIHQAHKQYRARRQELTAAVAKYLPQCVMAPSISGSSIWLSGPENLDAIRLGSLALEEGILIEPGDIHFSEKNPPMQHFRLGYSSILVERIDKGIEILGALLDRVLSETPKT